MSEVYGFYAGEVVNIKDPEHRGRVKVKIPDILGDSTSAWCEPCVPCCYEKGGDFCLPELKDYVWVTFIGGDIEEPVYLGGWWTTDNSPLGKDYKDPDTKRLLSFDGMKILFDSKKNSITISSGIDCSIELTKDNSVNIKGDLKINNLAITGSATLNGKRILTTDDL